MILRGCCCMRMDGVSQMNLITSQDSLNSQTSLHNWTCGGCSHRYGGQSQLKSAFSSNPPQLGFGIKMAWKNIFNGAARTLFTPRQPSVSSSLRTRMNHSTGGFEPLFPAGSGNIPPPIGFGLLQEAVVAAFRGLTVVSVGLLVADLIHGTEASHLRKKVEEDLAEMRKQIKVTDGAVEETRKRTESLKTSIDWLTTDSLQQTKKQKKAMQDFQDKQDKQENAMQDFKSKQETQVVAVAVAFTFVTLAITLLYKK